MARRPSVVAMEMPMVESREKIQTLQRDGYVFFHQLFGEELARQAHAEILRWCELDNQHRQQENIQEAVHHGPAGTTAKTHPSHLMIDVYGKSQALDAIVDIILTHPTSGAVFRRLAGDHYKFRGYNIRLMTGACDPGPHHPQETALPHEWHRDSPGEFGIGVFLTDVPGNGNAGTALMTGSHLFPYCPRWNTLFSDKYYATKDLQHLGRKHFARFNIFNRLLGLLLRRKAVEASGSCGDCYFFLNDVWHGRYPNLHGRQSMIVLIGGFPSEFPFPDEVALPPQEVMDRLPESIRRGLMPQPDHVDRSSIIHWMLKNRREPFPLGLFALARLERLIADRASLLLDWLDPKRQELDAWMRLQARLIVPRTKQLVKKTGKSFLVLTRRILSRGKRVIKRLYGIKHLNPPVEV